MYRRLWKTCYSNNFCRLFAQSWLTTVLCVVRSELEDIVYNYSTNLVAKWLSSVYINLFMQSWSVILQNRFWISIKNSNKCNGLKVQKLLATTVIFNNYNIIISLIFGWFSSFYTQTGRNIIKQKWKWEVEMQIEPCISR